MTITPSIHNKKAHDVNMGFQDLLASYQRVSKEQLGNENQVVVNLYQATLKDKLIYVNDDIYINGKQLSVAGEYVSTANSVALILYDETLQENNIAFFPLDKHTNNGKPFLLHPEKVSAIVMGDGKGEFIATDDINEALAFVLMTADSLKHYTVITTLFAYQIDSMVKAFARHRKVTLCGNHINRDKRLKTFCRDNVQLVSTVDSLDVLKSELTDKGLTTWEIILADTQSTIIDNFDDYLVWRENSPLKDTPVIYENGRFELYSDGLFFVRYELDTNNNKYHKNGYPLKICSPLFILASIRSQHSTDWGILMQWRDRDNYLHQWAMPLALLQGDTKEYRQILADLGLNISPSQRARNLLTAYLQTYDSPNRALSVNKTGWHDSNYVLPHRIIGASQHEPIVLQTVAPLEHDYSQKGTLQAWQRHISQPMATQSRIAFAISCAFAGQLLELIGEENGGGFHFVGNSSIGKSIALSVAGSVWGRNIIKSWRSTDNAMENVALLHNDSLLCLDEINEADIKTIGKTVYMLANGQPKQRMNKTGVNKRTIKWRVIVLSNGEQTLENYLRLAGETVKAGQEVRLCSIEGDTGRGLGVFDSLTLANTPAQQAEQLRANTMQFYGVAGIAWLEYLTSNKTHASQQVHHFMRLFLSHYEQLSGQAKRVANRFAIVAGAGELATQAGITGWNAGQAIQAVKACLDNWLANYGETGNYEERKIIQKIQIFIQKYGQSRFDDWDSLVSRTPQRVGFYRHDKDCYYFYSKVFEDEVCFPFRKKQVAEVLDKYDLLNKNHGFMLRVKSNNRDKRGLFYCVKSTILDLVI